MYANIAYVIASVIDSICERQKVCEDLMPKLHKK